VFPDLDGGFVILLVLGVLFFLIVVPVLAIRANLKIGRLEREIRRLGAMRPFVPTPTLGRAETVTAAQGVARGTEPEATAPRDAAPILEPAEAPAPIVVAPSPEPVLAPAPPAPPAPVRPAKVDFEQRLGGRIFVWIGAVMLALAGAFLVKYSIDQGLLSPAIRVMLGILLGIVLLGAGQWIRGQSSNIAQALTAAAVADWFASLFAAVALYHLLTPTVGFIALAVVTGIGIALALREGPLVGVVGIAGGFITPAIVASATPRPGVLFTYLFLIQLGALVLQHKRGWWPLAALGIGGGLLWAIAWTFIDPPGDGIRLAAIYLPLFLLATDLTQLWSLYGKSGVAVSREMVLTARSASIACFLIMAYWLTAGRYALDDWGFLIVLTLAHLAVARRFVTEEVPALVGAAIAIGAYAAWSPFGVEWISGQIVDRREPVILIGLLLGACFGFGGYWFELNALRPARWAGLSTLGTALLFGGAYLNLNEADLWLTWPIQAVILAALHMAAAERLNRLRHHDPKYTGALGLHCLAVTGFLALAVPMRLEKEWLSSAWSFELPVMAWIALRLDLPWLRRGIWAGGGLILAAVALSDFPAGDGLILNWLLYGIGIPCLSFIATARILKAETEDRETHRLVLALELAGAGLLALLIGLEADHFIGRTTQDSGADLLRTGVVTIAWAALAFGLFRVHRRSVHPDRAFLYAGWGFTVLACGALVLGGFALFNPLLDEIDVGQTWIFNRLLLVYGAPAALLLLIADALRQQGLTERFGQAPARLVGALALVTGFVWLTLTVRQMAQGPVLDTGEIGNGEQYGYSAVWTIYGLALLGLGTWARSQLLRYASAAVVLITVSKVFLIDASDLTGLYRVASFLGLGLCLIGIGYLYQRLLFRRPK
jgi:uncharacterized membrane protein